MDGNHAIGSTLVGLALTSLLVRLFWMASPPFNRMSVSSLAIYKKGLVVLSLVAMTGGIYLLGLPLDPEVARRVAEESYQFR